MGHLSHFENPHYPASGADRLGMLRGRTQGNRLVLGMRKKIQAPANPANKPDNHSHDGKHTVRDKRGEKKSEAEGGNDWPSRWRRQLNGILCLGGIVLHGQKRGLMK